MALKPGEATPTVPDPSITPGTTFDPLAFKTEILGEFQTRLNGLDKMMRAEFGKLSAPKLPPDPEPVDPNAPPVEPKEARTIAELNARVENLTKRLTATDQRVIDAEKAKVESENKRLETERLSAIDGVLGEMNFANPRAKQQFRDAYQGKIQRDEEGTLIVNTDKGPLGFDSYLKAEFDESPHLSAATGQGGAGATGGKRPAGGPKLDVLSMTPSQILALPAEQRSQMLADSIGQLAHS